MSNVRRIFVEKKPGFDTESVNLVADLKGQLNLPGLERVRLLVRYDVEGMDDASFQVALDTIFSEPAVDTVALEDCPAGGAVFAVEYLPGQYDQRADSAAQCVQMLTGGDAPWCGAPRSTR
jgi:phosphoribosylformylglycinamidine synthase